MTSTIPARRRRTVTAVTAAALTVLIAAAGCSASASAENNENADVVTYKGAQATFGESYTYADGLVVEVKKPSKFVPSEQAEGLEGVEGEAVKVRISIINGTDLEYVPNTLGVTLVSGGVEATQIIDPASRVELTGPNRPVNSAGVVVFDLAFVVQDTEDLTLTLTPALSGYEPLVYTLG